MYKYHNLKFENITFCAQFEDWISAWKTECVSLIMWTFLFLSMWKVLIFYMIWKAIFTHISLLFLPHIQDHLNELYPATFFQANGHFKSKGITLNKP